MSTTFVNCQQKLDSPIPIVKDNKPKNPHEFDYQTFLTLLDEYRTVYEEPDSYKVDTRYVNDLAEELVSMNHGIINLIASRIYNRLPANLKTRIDYQDLLQVGCFTVFLSIQNNKFNEGETHWSTYVSRALYNNMQKSVRGSWTFSTPDYIGIEEATSFNPFDLPLDHPTNGNGTDPGVDYHDHVLANDQSFDPTYATVSNALQEPELDHIRSNILSSIRNDPTLNQQSIMYFMEYYQAGKKIRDIANEYGVTHQAVSSGLNAVRRQIAYNLQHHLRHYENLPANLRDSNITKAVLNILWPRDTSQWERS